MRRMALAAVCFGVIFVIGCGSKPKDKIVGKWEATDPKEAADAKTVFEFKPDGTMVMGMSMGPVNMNMNGKYKFTADDVIEMEIEPPAEMKGAKKDAKKAKVEVTSDNLSMTSQDEKKETIKLKKAR